MRYRMNLAPGDDQKLLQLVQGNYFQGIRLSYGANLYVRPASGNSFEFGPPYAWALAKGTYSNLTGYWIYKSGGITQCWQAVNANGPLDFWNWDGLASPAIPQDWELFVFELVDANAGVVRVKNIYGRYVRFAPPGLACDAGLGNDAHFYVEFC